RRRHTRSKRDWSSDVCSSDLAFAVGGGILHNRIFIYSGLVVKFVVIIRWFGMVCTGCTGFLYSYTARIPLLPLAMVTPVAAASTNSPHQRISTTRFSR